MAPAAPAFIPSEPLPPDTFVRAAATIPCSAARADASSTFLTSEARSGAAPAAAPAFRFRDGMPIKIRVMPDCIVITTQNTRELYGCAEGLSVAYVNRQKMKLWLEGFPEILNDIGDLPVYRREDGRCM